MYIVRSKFNGKQFYISSAKLVLFFCVRSFGIDLDDLSVLLDYLFDERDSSYTVELAHCIVIHDLDD